MDKTSLARTIGASVDRLAPEATGMLQELVRTPSITGDEKAVQVQIERYLRALDLDIDVWNPLRGQLEPHPAFSDDGLPLGHRPVVVGRWPAAGRGRSLILNGHVDVVPVGDEGLWRDSPWSGIARDGQIWGRGSCDMKGGLAAAIAAVAALKQAGLRPIGEVLIESVIGEESGGVGTLSTVIRGCRADAAIVLEPTRMDVCPVGAGAATFRLHVPGRAAHGAMRLEGVSAIEKFQPLLSALSDLERRRHRAFRHPLFRPDELVAPISVGKIVAGDWPSTVPERLVAQGRCGVFPGESIGAARADLEHAIAAAADGDPWLREHRPVVEWFEGQFEPAETPLDAAILSVIQCTHAQVYGSPPAVRGVTYGSDLRFFTNNAGMPGVLYGPGDVALAHGIDEHVPIDEVIACTRVIALTIAEWCGIEGGRESERPLG